MAGLYIHIPFCKSRCIYCGFYSTTGLELRQQYVEALCREMEVRGKRLEVRGKRLETIYLGGGTPSQLTGNQLQQLFTYINKVYGTGEREITIEVNPDDVTPEYAATLSQLGVNRVSMGVQTFDNERLRFLHRRHTAEQIPIAIGHLRHAGIRNISIDLMYGFPGETINDWQNDISQALTLDVEHLSAYCLMIEEGTPLYNMLNNPKAKNSSLFTLNSSLPSEELERQMYELLIDRLTAAGYEHYELSNFARPGFRSRHNSSYWCDVPYIGLGAAAHSYSPPQAPHEGMGIRSYNVADIHQYIEAIKRGDLPSEAEIIDADTHYNDRITTALRTCEGLDLTTLSPLHRSYCEREARPFLADGMLRLTDNHLVLTRRGLFVSDYIMSSLIYL